MRTTIITVAMAGVLAITGCASSTAPAGPTSASSASAVGEGVTHYPLVLKNCGMDVTYPAPPKRVVTLTQVAAEILIHLGVGDRLVGSGYDIDKPPAEIAKEYAKVPILSAHGQEIKHEALLKAQPDFVYGTLASMFTAQQSGERTVLHNLGVPTYLTQFDCTYHEAVDNASFDLLFQEYAALAQILDVPTAGKNLIAEQRRVLQESLASAKAIKGTPSVMWFYSTYAGVPWAAGPGGIPQHISDLIGVKNIFAGAPLKWAEVSWDEVAAKNPDVIIIADLTRGEPNDTAQEKIALLKSDPLTSKLDAVVNNRFVIVPGRYMDPSYGSVYAVAALVQGLVALQ